jgi:anionic cell wall polymer biosynthesis LytR-Cps2A-Psr (LCP) family protein
MEMSSQPPRQPDHIHELTSPVVPANLRPWRLWLFGLTSLTCFGLIALSFVAQNAPADSGGKTVFSALSHFFSGEGGGAIGAEDDRVNILLLGVGGSGHDGPELSDTILFGSFRPSTGDVGLISVPRDLLVTIPGYGLRKVNHVNAYAVGQLEQKMIA